MKKVEQMCFLHQEMKQDNIFVPVERKKLSFLTGIPTRDGLDDAIVSGGKIVNVVSDNYCMLTNEQFFGSMDERLEKTGIPFKTRTINIDNRAFVKDYILDTDEFAIRTADGTPDKIKPTIRAKSSYDGSSTTSGHFGWYREWCSNRAHSLDLEMAFKLRRTGRMMDVLVPEIEALLERFINNEYYSIHKKYEVLAETPITDLSQFVKEVSAITGLFNWSKSEQNPKEPSKNARLVMEAIDVESKAFHTKPNMWIGYNAFNAFIHNTQNNNFDKRAVEDEKAFRVINMLAMTAN